jgi:hypothetical protein
MNAPRASAPCRVPSSQCSITRCVAQLRARGGSTCGCTRTCCCTCCCCNDCATLLLHTPPLLFPFTSTSGASGAPASVAAADPLRALPASIAMVKEVNSCTICGCRRLALIQDSHSCAASSISTAAFTSAVALCAPASPRWSSVMAWGPVGVTAGGGAPAPCCRTWMTLTATTQPDQTPRNTSPNEPRPMRSKKVTSGSESGSGGGGGGGCVVTAATPGGPRPVCAAACASSSPRQQPAALDNRAAGAAASPAALSGLLLVAAALPVPCAHMPVCGVADGPLSCCSCSCSADRRCGRQPHNVCGLPLPLPLPLPLQLCWHQPMERSDALPSISLPAPALLPLAPPPAPTAPLAVSLSLADESALPSCLSERTRCGAHAPVESSAARPRQLPSLSGLDAEVEAAAADAAVTAGSTMAAPAIQLQLRRAPPQPAPVELLLMLPQRTGACASAEGSPGALLWLRRLG